MARILGKTETCPREDKGASSGGQRRVLYDVVAGMGFSDQTGTKLVNLLRRYETMHHVDLTPEMIRDIPRWKFRSLRGAGVSIMVAFDKLQEVLR